MPMLNASFFATLVREAPAEPSASCGSAGATPSHKPRRAVDRPFVPLDQSLGGIQPEPRNWMLFNVNVQLPGLSTSEAMVIRRRCRQDAMYPRWDDGSNGFGCGPIIAGER